ncbi:MAG TPA: hypothetical protein VGC74_06125, partial [Stenotrophomonas sp.]
MEYELLTTATTKEWAMANVLDYAMLSNRVYFRPDTNRTELARDWSELRWLPDSPETGFSAGVYQKGSEIVISFTGTNENFDWVTNLPAGMGLGGIQLKQAMKLVMDTMQQYPGATISFTGHSLGGGIASLMAVFFDKKATIFDPAPFQQTAVNPVTLSALQLALLAEDYRNDEFEAYMQSLGTLFTEREQNVTSHELAGEILALGRLPGTVIAGTITDPVDIGDPSILQTDDPVDLVNAKITLHSMLLLNSALASDKFRRGVAEHANAVEVFFDPSLYAAEGFATPDFLAGLLNQHLLDEKNGASLLRLDALGEDLLSLGSTGTVGRSELNRGLLATLAEFYRFELASVSTGLVESLSGGVRLDLSRISTLSDEKGRRRLSNGVWDVVTAAGESARGLSGIDRLVLQAGSGVDLDYQAGDDGKADFVIGGVGGDKIKGGSGNDILYGDGGGDILEGGSGNDVLYGGGGDDLYVFQSNDSSQITFDTVRDLDGSGHLLFDGAILTGGSRLSEFAWLDATGRLKLSFLDDGTGHGTLVIDVIATGDSVRVENWSQGALGLSLAGDIPVVNGSPMTGDDDLFGADG